MNAPAHPGGARTAAPQALAPVAPPSLRSLARATLGPVSRACEIAAARARFRLLPRRGSFLGAYDTPEAAAAHAPAWALKGYAHEAVVDVNFEEMCALRLWDYPVLFWLQRLLPDMADVLDAGGHMGTKFRAFDPHLALRGRVRWTVYDTAPVVRAGRQRSIADGLCESLAFTDVLRDAPPADVLLASGLFQYFDGGPKALIEPLRARPRHIILNKVATREGPTVVTLERIGSAFVPYQIRSRGAFEAELDALGYTILESWEIATLSHRIRSHPELGPSVSRGYVLRQREGSTP